MDENRLETGRKPAPKPAPKVAPKPKAPARKRSRKNTSASTSSSTSDTSNIPCSSSASASEAFTESESSNELDPENRNEVHEVAEAEESDEQVLSKIAEGEYVTEFRKGSRVKSIAWAEGNFMLIRSKKTGKYINKAICSKCRELYKYKGSTGGTSALVRHLEEYCQPNIKSKSGLLPPTMEAKELFMTRAAQYCASDLRAPESMAGPGMLELIQTTIDIGHTYGRLDAKALIPHPKTVTRYIAKEADTARAELVKEAWPALSEGRCAATTDGWTDKHTKDHFSTLTLHFIVKWKLQSRVAFTVTVGNARTAEELKEFMREKLDEMGIPVTFQENIVFVTDGGADIVKALEDYTRLYCIAHALNVVVRTTLSVKYATLIEKALKSCPQAVALVEKCTAWVKDVREKLPKNNKELKKILKVSNAASQSHVAMLECVRTLRTQVEAQLSTPPSIQFSSQDFIFLDELVDFLFPFDLGGSREKSPTVSVSQVPTLSEHLEVEVTDSAMVTSLKIVAAMELDIMQAVITIDKCKSLVAYFRRSGLKKNLTITLKQEVETRWNSHLTMLESVYDNWDEVKAVLEEKKQQMKGKRAKANDKDSTSSTVPDLNTIDKNMVKKLIDFLKPFAQFTKRLEGEGYATLPYALPALTRLRAHCNPNDDDCEVMAAVRDKAFGLLGEKVQIRDEHKIATFLWPHMKHLDMLPPDEKAEVIEAVCRRMRECQPEVDPDTDLTPPPTKKPSMDDELFGDLMLPKTGDQDELDRYVNMAEADIGNDSDILKWWETQGVVRFPVLSKVAEKILCIPAASAPSERVWSSASFYLNDKSSSMSSSTLDNNLTLRDSLRRKRNCD